MQKVNLASIREAITDDSPFSKGNDAVSGNLLKIDVVEEVSPAFDDLADRVSKEPRQIPKSSQIVEDMDS